MDKKIIQLAEENKVDELVKTLADVENDELCCMIERKVLKGRNDTFTLVRAILLGSPLDCQDSTLRRCDVYKQCISSLQKNDMNNKMAAELVGLLMLEADTLPGPTLAELASVYVDGIKTQGSKTGKSLDLFPKLLSAIAAQENVVYKGNHMKGLDYKNHVLNQLCSCRWEPGHVIHLAAMFRDVPLTNDELKFVIEKVVRMLKDLDLENIPAVVYQLLLLSTKGHKKLVLAGIIQFFTEMDNKQKPRTEMECSEDLLDDDIDTTETLRHTEGTVILHISFAVKQHQDLGREFVKCIKSLQQCSATKMLSPFSLALALSLARIHRFEDQIFDVLKATIVKSYKDSERLDQSHWVQEIITESSSIDEYVYETIHNSKYGWDHVVQGLVQLGFILMDSFGPRGAFGRIDVVPSLLSGPSHSACKLGASMLLRTFKAHEMVRSEIVEQIFNRVITKATSPVVHYLDLLSDIVFASPQMLLDSVTKVREMFDYLAYLAPSSAEGLLRAIQPLLKLSIGLKDNLIVVLRKAMFSRQLDARKIGAEGFLMLLRHFRVLGGLRSSQCSQPSFSSSQVEVDIHTSYNPSSNEALCLEILGNLRRCLSQQADVRLLLYQGLVDVLDRNTQLREPILHSLQSQLGIYYQKNTDVVPPLKLDPCIIAQGDQVYLAEPLAHLLCCIQLCLIKSADIRAQQHPDDDDDDDDGGVQSELEKLMQSLTQRMLTVEMEDFELDKSADYSVSSSVGVRNNIFAILILGTYEVLMEFIFMSQPLSSEVCEQILQLFDCHKKLADVLREKSTAAANKKGKVSNKTAHSLLSLKMVNQTLELLLSPEEPDDSGVKSLCENHDFLKYMLSVCQQKLVQIQDKGQCDGSEGKVKVKLISYCSNIGRLLLCYYVKHQLGSGEQRVKEKHILTLTLECLVSIVTIISQQFTTEMESFLEKLDTACCEGSSSMDDKIYFHIKNFQRLVINIFSLDEENQSMKEAGLLLGVIATLSRRLPVRYSKTEHVLSWLDKLCKERTVDDLSVTKTLLFSLVSLGQRLKNVPVVLRDLAQDVHSQLGDIDQEIEVEDRTAYSVVTVRSAAPTVTQIILQQCERELEDTDWVITRIKADTLATAASQSGGDSPQLTQRESHEKSLCTRVGVLIEACHELVQSALPVGPCTELLLKTLTKLYTSLTLLVKYYLTMYSHKLGHLSARFERLVKLSGTHLTQYCYAMITFIQTAESEKLQNAAPDKGKKKKDDKKKGGQGQAAKASVLKQTRSIPSLIYAIEQYERYLIQLTKKSKVNLMEHMKNSTSRDFRINVAVLADRLDQESDSSPASSEGEEEEGDTTGAHEDTTLQEESRADDSEEDDDSDQENEAPMQSTAKPASTKQTNTKAANSKVTNTKLSNKKRPAAASDKEPVKKRAKLGPAKRTVGKPVKE